MKTVRGTGSATAGGNGIGGAQGRLRHAAGTRLLMSVSVAALLAGGASAVLAPSPALAVCLPTNTPANGETVICDAGTDTTGIQAWGSSDVTVTVTSSGAIDTTASGNDAISLLNGASVTIANGGSVTAEETAIALGTDGFVDIAGSVSNTADYSLMTLGERAEIIVRGTGVVESEGTGIQLTNGSLDVEAGGRIEVSRGSAIYMSGSTETDTFVATIAGTVLAQGEAHGFNLGSDYATINLLSGGSIRAISTGSNPRYAIVASGNSDVNLNGTVETDGASQSHAVLVFGRNTAVTIGPDGSIVTRAAQSNGIMSGVGDATIVVENGGEITAEGDNAFGIRAQGGNNSITVEAGGSVVSKGIGSNADAIRVDESSSGISTVRIDGAVEAQGANVYAIRAANAHVIVSGTVSSDNNAIQFFRNLYGDEENINRLELQPGFTINGSAWGSNDPAVQDILAFGGDSGSGTFDVARIGTLYTSGAQFAEFEGYEKIGNSTWTLTGTNNDLDPTAPWEVAAGTLLVNATMNNTSFTVRSDATLGGTGTVENIGVNGGILAAGGVGSIGTLTTAGTLVLSPSSVLHFDLGRSAGVPIGDLIKVGTTLTLDGGYVDIADAGDFGTGVYTLIEYGGLTVLSGAPVVRTNPDGGLTYAVSTTTASGPGAGEMRLTVSGGAGGNIQYWDADGAMAGAQGGTGIWDAANTNWIDDGGSTNVVWGSQFAVFDGTAGTVTVEGGQTFTGMQFLTSGYEIVAGTGGVLNAEATGATIRAGDGVTATLDVQLSGGPITKEGAGTLVLTAAEIVNPSAAAETLTVEGGELVIDGDFVADGWDNDTAVILRNGSTLTVTEFGSIDVVAGAGFTAVEFDGQGNVVIEDGGLVAGMLSGTASDSTVTIAGTLESDNAGYRPIVLSGSGNTITVASTGKIETTGNVNTAIRMIGGSNNNVISVDGLIKTHNSGSAGVELAGDGNEVTVGFGGRIETSGGLESNQYTPGIWVRGNGSEISVAGTVSTEGFNAVGVWTDGDSNTITVTGTVSTAADFNTGRPDRTNPSAILMEGGSNTLVLTGTASTAGIGVPTVVLSGDNSAMTLSGTVAAASASETAILFDGSSGGLAENTLELQPGYSITGLVIGDTGAFHNNLILGGDTGSGVFDVAAIGDTEQFRNFDRFYKDGNSVWTLTGTNDDLGAYWVYRGGTLLVNGSMADSGFSNLDNTATLGGSGTVGYIEALNGGGSGVATIAPGGVTPGTEIGTLTTTGRLTLESNAILAFDLGPAGAANVGGTANDLIVVGGDLTLDGTLNVTDAGGFGNGEYTLIQYGNLVADNGLDIGTMPDTSLTYVVDAGTMGTGAGNVVLTVSGGAAGNNQYWDGGNATVGVDGGNGVWNAGNTNWTNQAGTVNDIWGGQFAIFSAAAGTVTVQGPQAFTGMQFLTSGYEIVAGTGGELVVSLADTNIRTGSGITATITAPITGTGGIVKQEAGTLILAGALYSNTFSGATVVNGGTLRAGGVQVFSTASTHTIASGAVLDLDSYGQDIGGLSGDGRVLLGSSGYLGIGFNDANTIFGGVIEGDDGAVTKAGAGTLILTGENTFSGLLNVGSGTLSLGDGGAGGSVAADINVLSGSAALVFNRSDDFTYAGTIQGIGSTSFVGTGMATLTGDSGAYAGTVSVTAGNLRIASGRSLGSSLLTVGADGTLSGLGTIVGNVNVDGRLAPGADTLGTFTITGDVDFENGSTYAIRIAGTNPDPSPAATIDSLMVGGTADLTGGTVEIAAIDPRTSYVDGHTYATPILSATGGLGGTEFAGVGMTSDSAFITPTLSYVGNDVFLTIAVTQDFTTAAETYNQLQAATALNDLEQTGDALAVFNTIANMNADDARRAFDLTSGEVHAAGQHVIDQTFALFNRTLRYQGVAGIGSGNVGAQVFTAPLGYGPAVAAGNAGVVAIGDATDYADARVRGAWAAPLGGFGHVDSDGNAAKLDWWNAGLAGGYEGVIDVASGSAVGGFGFGYIHSRGTLDDRLSTFDADGFYLGAYGAWANGPWNVAGSLSYGANRVSTERNIAFMGSIAQADYWTHTIGASGEASYAFDLADTTKLAPLFTLDAGWSGHGGFTETGAGALNLTSGSESWTRLDAGLGIALTHTILTESGTVTLEGRAVWEHAFADVVPSQSLALAGSPTSFTVLGPDAGRDRLRLGAGLSWDVSDDMTLRARYDGLFSNSQANHSASIGLNIRF